MTGRLFNHGHATVGRAAKDALYRQRLDQFAQGLAETGSVAEAGRITGISRSSSGDYFRAIKRELGAQAI